MNVRVVRDMKEIGLGHAALEKLCDFLHLAEPSNATTVSDIQKDIVDAYNNVAYWSIISTVNEIEGM